MKRRILAVTILTLSMVVHAYGQNSLTDEFEGMSAKQRTQVAKQEQEDAANDPVFQKLMQEADSLARSRSYEAALDRYREARRQRPYNVRPKVRIQDLEDLIAKAALEQADEPIPAVPEAIHVPDDVGSPIPVEPEPRPEVMPVVDKAPESRPAPVRVVPARSEPAVRPAAAEPAPVLENGLHERTLREGQAIVIERTVVMDGNTTIYRKVKHPWGAIYYFKDGEPVSERIWTESSGKPSGSP